MEDFILREIDRLGEMLLLIARKLGLSDRGLETLMDILFHSDLDEARRNALLKDVLAYLDGKGCYSFRLHSLTVPKKD